MVPYDFCDLRRHEVGVDHIVVSERESDVGIRFRRYVRTPVGHCLFEGLLDLEAERRCLGKVALDRNRVMDCLDREGVAVLLQLGVQVCVVLQSDVGHEGLDRMVTELVTLSAHLIGDRGGEQESTNSVTADDLARCIGHVLLDELDEFVLQPLLVTFEGLDDLHTFTLACLEGTVAWTAVTVYSDRELDAVFFCEPCT